MAPSVFRNPISAISLAAGLSLVLAGCQSEAPQVELKLATEYVAPDEAEMTQKLVDLLRGNIEKNYPAGQTRRDAHPKAHGCVKAELTVSPDLPEPLRVGVFQPGKSYPAWVRYSTGSAKVESDSQKEFLGMAVKLMNVEGPKLLDAEKDAKTQDFLMIASPALPVANLNDAMGLAQASSGAAKLWFFLNPLNPHIKELRVGLAARKHNTSPLDNRYWSTTPYLFGNGRAVKYSAKPCGTETAALPAELTADYLRGAMKQQLTSKGACFDFMVQLQTDPVAMPIENALTEWSAEVSPFQKVARLTIPAQQFDSEAQNLFCDNLSMTPWHSLEEHRPLGNINRGRKAIYQEISKFRHTRNSQPRQEPTGTETF